jgi:hypothetical protein
MVTENLPPFIVHWCQYPGELPMFTTSSKVPGLAQVKLTVFIVVEHSTLKRYSYTNITLIASRSVPYRNAIGSHVSQGNNSLPKKIY